MERIEMLVAICKRAEKESSTAQSFGSRMSRMMDLESADERFNLKLEDLLNADNENFFHDVFGIWRESDRSTYPATFGLFVPRFAGKKKIETQ